MSTYGEKAAEHIGDDLFDEARPWADIPTDERCHRYLLAWTARVDSACSVAIDVVWDDVLEMVRGGATLADLERRAAEEHAAREELGAHWQTCMRANGWRTDVNGWLVWGGR